MIFRGTLCATQGVHHCQSSLLRSCAHSLESLTWHSTGKERYTLGPDPSTGNLPSFPKLRTLALGFLHFADDGTTDALVEPSLSILNLRYQRDTVELEKALQNRGRMPNLEVFMFRATNTSVEAYVTFLKANTQIRKVSIEGKICDEKDTPKDKPMEKILSLLSSSFKNITSLRLI